MHDFKNYPELTNSQMTEYYFLSPHKQITENFRAKVVEVHDGDTIKVMWEKRNFPFKIRFAKVAAPELNEKGGIEARDWLSQKILNEEVEIIINPHNRVGKWGRLIGEVLFDGININEEIIREGKAVSFSESRRKNTIQEFNNFIKRFEIK